MQILLIAATELEIAPFLQRNPSADHLISGVGCPATIYHLSKRVQQFDYDLVIQAGIAGSFKQSLTLGDVVLVEQDCFADLGISEKNNFYTIFEKGFSDQNDFPFSGGWLKNENPLLDHFPLPKVKAVTVNTVTDNEDQINQLGLKFDPVIETMEGAALHYVCRQENIPFLQVRSISNYIGERNKENWKIKEAIENLDQNLRKILDELNNEKGLIKTDK
jgi:futalosine hydrolase